MPDYSHSEYKEAARSQNMLAYRHRTGRNAVPTDRGYWTLCNTQPQDQSELVQLRDAGFLVPKQFHGIDTDATIIRQNREWHPDAHWHCGDWREVIRRVRFNPAVVYLDMTGFAISDPTISMIIPTMYLCPVDTMLFINVMATDPYRGVGFDLSILQENLERSVSPLEWKKWDLQVERYQYNISRHTEMCTYIMYKEAAADADTPRI